MLLFAGAVALLWANSPWAASYIDLWHLPLTIGRHDFVITEPLHFWVNDGLMTIFFLVVGLEIRREIHEGALASLRVAALPVAAALGGILVPAVIYLALSSGHAELREGWAVPTATDIAFAVGVLTLLGRRVPATLRVLLLAIAIVDDIAAVLVIAFFYAGEIALGGLGIVLAGVACVFLFQRLGFKTAWPYVLPGAMVWFGMLYTGVHPSIAGVMVGLLTPMTHAFARANPLAAAARALEEFRDRFHRGTSDTKELLTPLRELKDAQLEFLPPALRVQTALHPWVAFGIVPLFALANAGVNVGDVSWEAAGSFTLVAGIAAGLLLGKPLGIVLAVVVSVRLGLCALPKGVSWSGIVTIGCLGGIGFTMSIFIANLAFQAPSLLESAKLGILAASAVAVVVGLTMGRLTLGRDSARREPATRPAHASGGIHD
jgi:Na+:H+ antiporter, NhaA family